MTTIQGNMAQPQTAAKEIESQLIDQDQKISALIGVVEECVDRFSSVMNNERPDKEAPGLNESPNLGTPLAGRLNEHNYRIWKAKDLIEKMIRNCEL